MQQELRHAMIRSHRIIMIHITHNFAIPEREIEEKFITSAGPGGQNVNKVATAVQLRYDLDHSTCLLPAVIQRLKKRYPNQITKDNVLMVESSEHRTQARNRQAARKKLAEMIRQSLYPPKRRIKTHPTRASKEKRLNRKQKRSQQKQMRKHPPAPDDF